jgi:PEP-CTERM motif
LFDSAISQPQNVVSIWKGPVFGKVCDFQCRFVCAKGDLPMTKRLHSVLPVLVLLACGLVPLKAVAGPITYTATFTAAGTVNGNPFDAVVTFTLSSDTTLVFGNCDGVPGIFCTPNGVAGVSIQGIGSGTFTDPFNVFVNQGVAVAGFTDDAIEDILDLSNPAFSTYDLKSAIGPLPSSYFFVDTGASLGSTLGTIVLDSTSGTPTFTATTTSGTTPEPGSLVLFGSGVVGLATVIRRKLRA